jgi:class 3 adenylate cyclase
MASYRTTVILKTDIVDSTPRLAGQTQAEMGLQRKQHKQFISGTALKHHGLVFQEEGDAYLIEFPSVTDAVRAAIAMHQNLHSMQAGKGEKQRLAIRAVITVGDLLRQETDTIGMTMNLLSRMEKFTPPDEIYLSQAAWLVLNKAEVQTSFVAELNLKGFNEPEKVYKVDQKSGIRVISNQYLVFTDVRGWTAYIGSKKPEEVESLMSDNDDLHNEICNRSGGVIRNVSGDQYFLTFSEKEALVSAVESLRAAWNKMTDRYGLGLAIAIHKGALNIVRSFLYGNDIHTTVFLAQLNRSMHPGKEEISIIVSGAVRQVATGTRWEHRFQEVDASKIVDERIKSTVKTYGAFWLSLEDDAQQ